VVGHIIVELNVAGSNPVSDAFSACSLLTTILAVVDFVGTWGVFLGKELNWGGIPGRSDEN